jgi:hypothetical protein
MKNKMALSKEGYRTNLGQKMINKSTQNLLNYSLLEQSEDQKERRLRKPTY